jgi:hypothetical protein
MIRWWPSKLARGTLLYGWFKYWARIRTRLSVPRYEQDLLALSLRSCRAHLSEVVVSERLPVFPAAPAHHDGRKNTAVPQQITAPSTPEVVNVEVGPSLVAGLRVSTLAGALYSAVDRVRLDIGDRLFGIPLVRERPNGAGELLRDRCRAVLPAFRVVVPHAEEAVGACVKSLLVTLGISSRQCLA